ncbi:MAG: hypothetical protein KDH96_10090 [Candidatus Riesia sp.]|nr:hypothetical protein [Candidatus Riesia sp.]
MDYLRIIFATCLMSGFVSGLWYCEYERCASFNICDRRLTIQLFDNKTIGYMHQWSVILDENIMFTTNLSQILPTDYLQKIAIKPIFGYCSDRDRDSFKCWFSEYRSFSDDNFTTPVVYMYLKCKSSYVKNNCSIEKSLFNPRYETIKQNKPIIPDETQYCDINKKNNNSILGMFIVAAAIAISSTIVATALFVKLFMQSDYNDQLEQETIHLESIRPNERLI